MYFNSNTSNVLTATRMSEELEKARENGGMHDYLYIQCCISSTLRRVQKLWKRSLKNNPSFETECIFYGSPDEVLKFFGVQYSKERGQNSKEHAKELFFQLLSQLRELGFSVKVYQDEFLPWQIFFAIFRTS